MIETKFFTLIDGIKIPAVFLSPPKAHAAILLVPGSLNSDVDGNYAPMIREQPPILCHHYKDIAEQLAAQGIAVLRFAKQGPGTGCVTVNEEEAAENYKFFLQRVRVADFFLKELENHTRGLPHIIAGHSEGAIVAILLAQRKPNLKGVVLLSSPALPLLRLLLLQRFELDRKAGLLTVESERHYQESNDCLDDFIAERPRHIDLTRNPYSSILEFAAQPQNALYLRSLEQVDPAVELAKVIQPTLIIQGGRDLSVFAENAEKLRQAKPDAKIHFFPEIQHMYKRVPDGLSSQESFSQTSESDPEVTTTIASWLRDLP